MSSYDFAFALSDEEWKRHLDAQSYRVLRQAGTEAPGTGKYLREQRDGSYHCGGCGALLFDAETKFDSGCGWPSFYQALPGSVIERPDTSHGMLRTEVICANCGSHLGHVFPDAPQTPTGQRYCMNSVSLDFRLKEPDSDGEAQ
ncbi:MAG: peptide-methionine (R)-S-oxide reductase MsrB [Varibaculum sp.]|nr:peptide-methionine (R)-S-oxide reductase MsrB [Varibaculum sp.]